jgi:Leucine-rich repeat (LRR) protein
MVELNKDLLINKFGYKLDHEAIMISSTNINKIDSNAFKEFTELDFLSLSDNQIEELEGTIFESLLKLEVLFMCDNRLKRIKTNTFKSLTQLQTLKLSKNQLTTIDANSFLNLSNLRDLCLYKNQLKRIESDVFKGLVNLKTLQLNYNQIEEIQEGSFNGLSNLKELQLDHNKLKRIGANLFGNLNKLETLLLDHNELEEIHFNGLSNLKELHLESNKQLEKTKRSCFDDLKSIKLIQLDDTKFKVFSFLDETDKEYYNKYSNKLKNLGFLTDWNSFLGQFQKPIKDFHNLRLLIVDYYDSLIRDIDIYTDELLAVESKPGSTNFHEYFGLVRSKAIEEINKAKCENLERYEANKEKYKFDRNELTDEKLESIKSELFEEKFCFLLRINDKNSEFNLITVVCDFYLNQFDLSSKLGLLNYI